jgi:DNA-binding LytR/AlgR family response regulator
VLRLQERLRAAQPALNTEALLRELAVQLQRGGPGQPLRWIRASIGASVRLIAVDDVDFLRSEDKYTVIAWRDEVGKPREAVIRTALKELAPQLDATQFAQVHRSVMVNLRSVASVTRNMNETADIHLKGRDEVLPVSRTYLHLFRQM